VHFQNKVSETSEDVGRKSSGCSKKLTETKSEEIQKKEAPDGCELKYPGKGESLKNWKDGKYLLESGMSKGTFSKE